MSTDKTTPLSKLIGVLQGAEIELGENDGYDLCRPLGVRVSINSLLAGLGVEPKDLQGEVGTATDPALVFQGKQIAHRVNHFDEVVAALRSVEWIGPKRHCPGCGNYEKPHGVHHPECEVGKALAAVRNGSGNET